MSPPATDKHRLRHIFTELSRERVEQVLRTLRPLPERYFLEQAAFYESMERCPELERGDLASAHRARGLVLSPDPRFVHVGIREWLSDHSLEHLSEMFCKMGIYQHEDLVNVSCRIRRCQQFRRDLQLVLGLDTLTWLSLKSAVLRYARPIDYPFVKASKVSLDPDDTNECLFDEGEWRSLMKEATDEGQALQSERLAWVEWMTHGRREGDALDKGDIEVKQNVRLAHRMDKHH